jgi:lysophospholipase L1-like esterase
VRSALRWIVGRLALVVVGLVVGLVLLEILLQIAGTYVGSSRREREVATGAGLRVVSLGDSNTYGLWVGRDRAYPHLLEVAWNTDGGTPPIHVVNLGYPGTNSSVLRNRFPDILRIHHPDVVTIMVGVNDLWTVAEPVGVESGGDAWDRWKRWSRVYQLLYMLSQGRGYMPGMSSRGRWAPANQPPADWEPRLRTNLEYMVATAREAGVQPILLTYPASNAIYHAASRTLRRVGSATGAPVIDVTPFFGQQCAGGKKCPLLFRDQHPTVAGHQLAAQAIASAIKRRNLLAQLPPPAADGSASR